MDEADVAGELVERAIEGALHQRLTAAVRRAAMEAGAMCMICGGEIPEGRRRVLPGVCTCVSCQDTLERSMGR